MAGIQQPSLRFPFFFFPDRKVKTWKKKVSYPSSHNTLVIKIFIIHDKFSIQIICFVSFSVIFLYMQSDHCNIYRWHML